MKTLYSSTFLSAVLAFLLLLGQTEQPVNLVQTDIRPIFKTIVEAETTSEPSEGVSVEVFNSFGCPDCDVFGLGTLSQLHEKYGNDETEEFHLYLTPDKANVGELYAVKGAHCAAKFGRFWDMVRELHGLEVLSRREVDLTSQGLGLPIVEFRRCLDSDEMMEQIDADIARKRERAVDVRPTVFVNDVFLIGAHPLENIEREIQRSLNP